MLERLLYWLGWPLIRLYAWVMLKIDVWEHAPMPDGPKIIAVNHPSCTDPFLTPLLSSHRVSILITEKAFQVPIFGHYLKRSGHICVAPGKGETVLEKAEQLLNQGRTVVIFPEGHISPKDGGFHPARTGVARLALRTGAPVIPIGIHLPRERLYSLTSNIEGENAFGDWYFHGPYHITVGKPMRFEGDIRDREHVVSVSRTIMQHIIGLAQQSAARMQAMLV